MRGVHRGWGCAACDGSMTFPSASARDCGTRSPLGERVSPRLGPKLSAQVSLADVGLSKDLNQRAGHNQARDERRPYRKRCLESFGVHRIHFGEMVCMREIDLDLDNIIHAGARRLDTLLEIAQRLSRLCTYAS